MTKSSSRFLTASKGGAVPAHRDPMGSPHEHPGLSAQVITTGAYVACQPYSNCDIFVCGRRKANMPKGENAQLGCIGTGQVRFRKSYVVPVLRSAGLGFPELSNSVP